jgi:hypothetical protein
MAVAGDVRLKTTGHGLQKQIIDLTDKKPAETVSRAPDTAVSSISASEDVSVVPPTRRPNFGSLPPVPTNLPPHLSCETREDTDGSWVMMFYPNKKN